jgi:hypothetical protein
MVCPQCSDTHHRSVLLLTACTNFRALHALCVLCVSTDTLLQAVVHLQVEQRLCPYAESIRDSAGYS